MISWLMAWTTVACGALVLTLRGMHPKKAWEMARDCYAEMGEQQKLEASIILNKIAKRVELDLPGMVEKANKGDVSELEGTYAELARVYEQAKDDEAMTRRFREAIASLEEAYKTYRPQA
jgi:hypothetical protein